MVLVPAWRSVTNNRKPGANVPMQSAQASRLALDARVRPSAENATRDPQWKGVARAALFEGAGALEVVAFQPDCHARNL